MDRRMQGMVAFVTGAGSGIGLACAARFVREGATVAGFDLQGGSAFAEVAAGDRSMPATSPMPRLSRRRWTRR